VAYGNAPRNILRGPGTNTWDFQLFKDTQVTEGKMVELRIEFYNLFNHTRYDPIGVITDISAVNFRAVTTTLPPRRIQLAAKLYFYGPLFGRRSSLTTGLLRNYKGVPDWLGTPLF
jgi:hypothetical protein